MLLGCPVGGAQLLSAPQWAGAGGEESVSPGVGTSTAQSWSGGLQPLPLSPVLRLRVWRPSRGAPAPASGVLWAQRPKYPGGGLCLSPTLPVLPCPSSAPKRLLVGKSSQVVEGPALTLS